MISNKKIQTVIISTIALVVSIGLGYLFKDKNLFNIQSTYERVDTNKALFEQKVEVVLDEPIEITKLYNEDQLVGIITDESKLETLFNNVYENEYKEEFPNTKLGFMQDIYQTKELSYNVYEDIDEKIFQYVYDKDLIAIEVDKISFSNGAVIYVKNKADFDKARREFFLSYINEDAYNKLINNEAIASPTTYGTVDKKLEVKETITTSRGLASIGDIMLNDVAILNFLSFGYNPEYQTYTVQEYDTIQGIAWLNSMTQSQILSINKTVISDVQQVLKPGIQLNVTKFNSPFTVQITKERMVSEVVYPDDIVYRNDPDLREGLQVIDVHEEYGSRDVLYEDVYINEIAVSSVEKSSVTTRAPIRGVIRVGTKVEPKIGSGAFRWPMNNARITCGWYCYPGHQAIDFQAIGNGGYGPILAADRGVVVTNSYLPGTGYTIIIDHNNGYITEYGHMNAPGYFPVGSTVRKGEQIGYIGMTGITTGPHVHMVVRLYGTKINPCTVLAC